MNEPAHLFKLLGELPEDVSLVDLNHSEPVNFIHIFCRDLESLHAQLPLAKEKLDKNGMLWVSWIKKASKNYDWTITDQDVRDFGLLMGLVDTKVCAVDEDWSGLKFMYRKEDR